MRKVLLRRRRRGGEVDPITAAYDQILATDPTVPILLRLREYRGQQVLFTNAACTIPVESIGDPTGGGRSAENGEIIFTQSTDAARPLWGGESIGLVQNGSSEIIANSHSMICTLFCSLSVESKDRRNCAFSSQPGDSFASGVTVEFNAGFSDSIIRSFIGDSEGGRSVTALDVATVIPGFVIPEDEKIVLCVRITDTQTTLFVDGILVFQNNHGLSLVGKESSPLRIGERPYSGPVSLIGSHFDFLVYETALSDEKIAEVTELLA